jgi:uncharacterized integral membrane protein
MADERHDGPADGANGGPVTPGAEPPGGARDGNGNGSGAGHGLPGTGHHPGTVAVPDRDQRGPGPDSESRPESERTAPDVRRTRVSGLWVAVTLSAVVLVFLLIFILQNNVPTEIHFLGAQGTLPVGVALLFAAALGILLVAIPGYLRILQLRRAARRHRAR